MAWQFLDQQFSTPQKASQQILHDLIHGQTITASDPTALSSFSHRCQAAELLRQVQPGSLASLDELTTQHSVFKRLDKELSIKWFEYQGTHLRTDEVVPFDVFARWIQAQAKIHTRRQCLDDSNGPPESHLTSTAPQTTMLKSNNPSRGNQGRKQNPIWNTQNQRR